jgi:hypothetical membrane protein
MERHEGPGRGRLGALAGIVGPVTFMVLYVLAAVGDPEYVFFESYLSDLGVGRMAVLFNAAVIIAGSLTVPFAILAIRPSLDGGIAAEAAVGMTVVSAAFLFLVGVFTEDWPVAHRVVSYGFFMSMLVGLLCYSWSLHFSNALGRPITQLTEVVAATGLVLVAFGFDPRTETVAVLMIVIWGLMVAASLLHRGTDADTY